MKTLAPSVTNRDPKGRKFMSVVAAQYDKAGLSEDEAQNVNNTSGLAAVIADFISKSRNSKRFADEEVSSNYGYLSGYAKPKGIAQQVKIIHDLFPEVKWGYFRPDEEQIAVPDGAEGLFAIPRWQTIAPTYAVAVKIVLAKLKETRKGKFINYRECEMTSANLCESAWKAEAVTKIEKSQEGHDILVVPAQFGIMHRGRSVRQARAVIGGKGFGLGAFEVGIMLLTHPERLQHYNDLYIDCAGDEFKPSGGREFSHAPVFFVGNELKFDALSVGRATDYYGSASASLPQ